MKTKSQAGISTLQIIIALAVGAVILGLISLFSSESTDQLAQQEVDQVSQTIETESPLEAFADTQAESITNPVIEAAMEKDEEIKAEMETEVEAEVESESVAEEVAVVEPELTPDPEPVPASGIFTDYDPSLLAAGETNILFFHADWCPSCRGLENDLNANLGAIPAGVNILKLDYDSETELKREYGVIRQHTLVVVDGDGNEVRKLTGLTNTLDQVVGQL